MSPITIGNGGTDSNGITKFMVLGEMLEAPSTAKILDHLRNAKHNNGRSILSAGSYAIKIDGEEVDDHNVSEMETLTFAGHFVVVETYNKGGRA